MPQWIYAFSILVSSIAFGVVAFVTWRVYQHTQDEAWKAFMYAGAFLSMYRLVIFIIFGLDLQPLAEKAMGLANVLVNIAFIGCALLDVFIASHVEQLTRSKQL